MKDNKNRLFEMMNKVSGMKLNEETLSYKTDEDPINNNGYNDDNGNTIILNYYSSTINIKNRYGNHSFEFEQLSDCTIDTDWPDLLDSLSQRGDETYIIKVIDYNGNMVNELERNEYTGKFTIKSVLNDISSEFGYAL